MPSVCELKIELKKRHIKGISGLNKRGLEKLLASGTSAPKETPKETPKAKPLLLTLKDTGKYAATSTIKLLLLEISTTNLIKDSASTYGERTNAKKKLEQIQESLLQRTKKDLDAAKRQIKRQAKKENSERHKDNEKRVEQLKTEKRMAEMEKEIEKEKADKQKDKLKAEKAKAKRDAKKK